VCRALNVSDYVRNPLEIELKQLAVLYEYANNPDIRFGDGVVEEERQRIGDW
jgi:hypothetical protein